MAKMQSIPVTLRGGGKISSQGLSMDDLENELIAAQQVEVELTDQLEANRKALEDACQELKSMNDQQTQMEQMLEQMHSTISKQEAKISRKDSQLNALVDELSEMEKVIKPIRNLLDTKTLENKKLHREVRELKTELEMTQNQVLELANIVSEQDNSREDLKKEMEEKHRLRDLLEKEQETLCASLETNLSAKLTELEAEKATIEALRRSLSEAQAQHEQSTFRLEELHASECAEKDDALNKISIQLAALETQWNEDKAAMEKNHALQMESQKQEYEALVTQIKDTNVSNTASLNAEHQAEVERHKEDFETLKSNDAAELEKERAESREVLQQHQDNFEEILATKDREIAHLRVTESNLYDVEIELSMLQAKYNDLVQDMDARVKWRKDHHHSTQHERAWFPPDTPNPGFKLKDDPSLRPSVDTDQANLKKTFTKPPDSFKKMVSTKPKVVPMLPTSAVKAKFANTESKLKSTGLMSWEKKADVPPKMQSLSLSSSQGLAETSRIPKVKSKSNPRPPSKRKGSVKAQTKQPSSSLKEDPILAPTEDSARAGNSTIEFEADDKANRLSPISNVFVASVMGEGLSVAVRRLSGDLDNTY